jgi:hypothetical protein
MAMVAPNPNPFDWKYSITQSDHDANMYQITSGGYSSFNAPPKSYYGRQMDSKDQAINAALFLTVLKTVPGVAVLEDCYLLVPLYLGNGEDAFALVHEPLMVFQGENWPTLYNTISYIN